MTRQNLRSTWALGIIACAVAVPSFARGQDRIISPDSSAAIALPASFQPLQLNPRATLQFGDSATDSYVIVVLENRKDLVGWNLTRHSMVTVAQVLAKLDLPEVVGPVSLTIGGHPAVQYELRGATQGTRIAYLHTSIESPSTFAQIVAWTVSSRWNANEKLLREVTSSVELMADIGTLSDDPYDIVQGIWAWEDSAGTCTGLTQRFVISQDRKSMKIHHSEPIEDATGGTTTVTDYVIEGGAGRVLHTYIPGETRLTAEGNPVKWDLVVIGRNRIAWHRADWAEAGLTRMLRRCDQI